MHVINIYVTGNISIWIMSTLANCCYYPSWILLNVANVNINQIIYYSRSLDNVLTIIKMDHAWDKNIKPFWIINNITYNKKCYTIKITIKLIYIVAVWQFIIVC